MAVITEINGVSTSGTTGINNIFGSGGGGLAVPSLGASSGVQIFGSNISSVNSDLHSGYNRSTLGLTSYSGSDFVTMAIKKTYATAFVVTSDGKMHYNTSSSSWMTGATVDGNWHEDTSNPTGTSGNWTWVSCDDGNALAIRGGDVCFRGYGNYRQRGDGATSSTGAWEKTYDGSTDAAVRVYMSYRVAYMITASGRLYSTGYRYEGMTGDGSSTGQSATWTDISPTGITCESFGAGYRCAKFIDQNGDVWSFGDNNNQHAGPLVTSTTDLLVPTQSTNTQPFLNGTMMGGADGDMFAIVASNGDVYVQGEGGGRMNPEGGTLDYKNAWSRMNTVSGTVTAVSPPVTGAGSADRADYWVKTDGSLLLAGSSTATLTASSSATGTAITGNPPYTVLGSGANVYMVHGASNRYIVGYG